jgi:bifunctional UDP-N-acetylglucosamine pyrophosphorylase / glucosamine-1-phosphate N-acetyltransferase
MIKNETTILILAAGKGTRMKSALPKVLHEAAGMPLLGHVIEASKSIEPSGIVVVVAPTMDDVASYARSTGENVETCVQHEPNGTGDAARAALDLVPNSPGTVVFFNGDTALMTPETITALCQSCASGSAVSVLGFEAADPTNYGRLVQESSGELVGIVEEKDATDEQRKLTLCNGGAMAISREYFHDLLAALSVSPKSGEIYITEVPELARARGLKCSVIVRPEEEIFGVDSRDDLAFAEKILQQRLRNKFLRQGVTLRDPESVYFCIDTIIGSDVVIEPNVVFGPGVTVGDNVTIKAFSHIEETMIGNDCAVGPFARLRPGTTLGKGAKVGNFVETKKANIEAGAKISHLTYIGDARVGEDANIGAGTITCNYDGFNKHFTDIGAGAFVGSNSSLVAPVKIGDGSYVGSGSVITKDVEADSLAVTRAQQNEKPGWAARFRKAQIARKAKKG